MPDFNEALMPAIQDAIIRISNRVYGSEMTEDKFGFMNLLWETAKQETLGGKLDPENINQITSIFIQDYDRLERLATSNAPAEAFDSEQFNIEVDKEGNPDISDPYTNFAMTAIGYIAKTKGFADFDLSNVEDRADIWKTHHNTMLGAGNVEQYLDKARGGPQIMWGHGGSMLTGGQ